MLCISHSTEKQNVLERNNPPTFLILFYSSLSNLQRYGTEHKLENCTQEWFRVCPNIFLTLKLGAIAIFKSFIKQGNDLN
jgi:hypothetical protein